MTIEETFPGELEELRTRLREAEETLEAIRSGAVDAIVVSGTAGERVYTLQGADQSYRLLVEAINEGTVTMSLDGTIVYSNRQFADLLGCSLEEIIGSSFSGYISQEDRHFFEEALRSHREGGSRFQVLFESRNGGKVPAQMTLGRTDESLSAVITDLSEQLSYREIVREEKLSRSIIENSPDGIAVCDAKGKIIRASRALETFSGEHVLLKPFDELFRIEIQTTEGQPAPFSASGVLAGKPLHHAEALLRCAGIGTHDISLSAVPLRNEGDAVIGCLITITDITERKRAEQTLSEQSAKLEAANRELESFAYSISHDLRAPLRAIDGFTRMLLRKTADRLDDDEKRQFEVIRDNTQRMGQLIDDVLAFSRLGRQSISLAAIDMPELAKAVWEELLTINPGRRMSLNVATLPPACGDSGLIRQVLANLLSNAVKFTRKRENALIEIGGKTGDSETVFFVRDNGVGFDMGYYEKLFGVFQRLHSQDEYEGSGAGLAIVQRIIDRHGGRVWAEGVVDQGACFYFSLPVPERMNR